MMIAHEDKCHCKVLLFVYMFCTGGFSLKSAEYVEYVALTTSNNFIIQSCFRCKGSGTSCFMCFKKRLSN